MSEKGEGGGSVGQSILAVVVGAVAGVGLTLATDAVLHAVHFYPPLRQFTPSGPLAVATAYRAAYGLFGSWVTARMAPRRPMKHALILGAIGTVVSIVGAVVTWNQGLGPHWYPVALVALAMPQAWLGGKLGKGS